MTNLCRRASLPPQERSLEELALRLENILSRLIWDRAPPGSRPQDAPESPVMPGSLYVAELEDKRRAQCGRIASLALWGEDARSPAALADTALLHR